MDWITNYTCFGESSDTIKEKDGAYDIRYDRRRDYICTILYRKFLIEVKW